MCRWCEVNNALWKKKGDLWPWWAPLSLIRPKGWFTYECTWNLMRLCFSAGAVHFQFVWWQHSTPCVRLDSSVRRTETNEELSSVFRPSVLSLTTTIKCKDTQDQLSFSLQWLHFPVLAYVSWSASWEMRNTKKHVTSLWQGKFMFKEARLNTERQGGLRFEPFFHCLYSKRNEKIFFRVMYLYQRYSW